MTRALSTFGVLVLLLPLLGSQPSPRSSLNDAPPSLQNLCLSAHSHVSRGRYEDAARQSRFCALQAQSLNLPKLAARAWSWLATAELGELRYQSAAKAFLRARDFAAGAGDFSMEAVASFNLSNVYLHLGSIDSAAAAMESVMRLRDRANRALPPVQILFHFARVTSRLHGMDAAIPHSRQALELAGRKRFASWKPTVEESYAVELLLAGRLPDAALHAAAAIELREKSRDAQLGGAYLTMARVRLAGGQPEESLDLVSKAFAQLKTHKPQRPLYAYFLQRALAYSALGQLDAARADLRNAVGQIRSIRPQALPSDTFRVSAAAGHELVYAALAEVSARLYLQTGSRGALVESFEASAENRALALRAASQNQEEPPPGYAEALRDLQAAELESLRDSATAQSKIDQARLRLAELDLGASRESIPSRAATVQAAQASLDANTALIHFQLGTSQSFAWVITRGTLDVLTLPPSGVLSPRIREFRQSLESGSPAASLQGHEMFKSLFGALPNAARAAVHWKLVPDTTLFHLPFPALVARWDSGRPRFLIEDRELSLAHFPGSTPPPRPQFNASWQGFGDAVYNAADPRFPHAAASSFRLPRLPGTAREIQACARLWPRAASVHLGPSVNIAQIQSAIQTNPEVLHLATHLIPAAGNPEQSRLVLSLNSKGEPELLDPATVATLRASCRLVVMTGCRAGAGSAIASEGLLGLTRSWMVAGAEAVAATYWPMPDDSGDLIFSFYRHWRQSSDAPSAARASHALRLAQLDMLRSESWRARPSYWASYFVMGKS